MRNQINSLDILKQTMFITKIKRGIFFKENSKTLKKKMINTYTAEDKIFLKCSHLAKSKKTELDWKKIVKTMYD